MKYLVHIIGRKEISTNIQLESALVLDALIKDQTFIFSDSCIEYLECNLAANWIEKQIAIQTRIKELMKSYIKYRGLNNWVDILNSLLNNLKTSTPDQEFQQNVLDLLNKILEKCSEVVIKNCEEMVNFFNTYTILKNLLITFIR